MHGSCTHGAVQLVGGSTTNQGRVEVCVGQTWGTVCQYGFYNNDAKWCVVNWDIMWISQEQVSVVYCKSYVYT